MMKLNALMVLFATATQAIDFAVPSAAERTQAIGDISGGSPLLKRAFTEEPSLFAPVPKPKQYDWLASHEESCQTFATFAANDASKPDATHRKLYLLPIGDFPAGTSPSLTVLSQFAEAFFGLPVAIMGQVTMADLGATSRINKGTHKRQLLSTDILAWLPKQKPKDAFSVLAVTMEDLYPDPKWNFVFGQASLAGGTGVFSFARYDPQFFGEARGNDPQKLILLRSMKVLAHEAGHMFGIEHCTFFHCLMNGANHMQETDASPLHICPMCLRKLHHCMGFNVLLREQALLKSYEANGLNDEAAWEKKRILFLQSGGR